MADTTIDFPCGAVGLVVRGKRSATDHPGWMAQHADCVLDNGSPVGFFGEEGAGSGGSSGRAPSSSGRSGVRSTGSSNASGLNMKGVVYDFAILRRMRLPYVDLTAAERANVQSTLVKVNASDMEREKFAAFWRGLYSKPGVFNLLGGNCSSHAAEAFAAAGMIPAEIPGLDTPDNLYEHLLRQLGARCTSYSGFLGFERRSADAYRLIVRPALTAAAAAR